MNRLVVAIDGAAGSGKSTLARGLAKVLGLPYVNTGLMYRALAASAIRSGVAPDDEPGLLDLARRLRFTVEDGAPPHLEVETYGLEELTSVEVEATVSEVSSHASVRAALRDRQRELGADGAVMEGRDIGSVVFPDAAVKLYLVADQALRAERRADERTVPGSAVRGSLADRDRRDAETNPFVPPDGSTVLDTGRLDVEAALERALEVVRERAPWLIRENPRA